MPLPKKKKTLTEQEALQKMISYCSYQERSSSEAFKKLYGFGLEKDAVQSIIDYLLREGYINEDRFTESFTGGKFRMKKWGKLKIEQSLKKHNIDNQIIIDKLDQLSQEEYEHTLQQLLQKKNATLKEDNPVKKFQKLVRYALQKGYESELVYVQVRRLIPELE
ncbi:MAG: RecX family transcriptional regulator [Cytophagaceae bacterium]|jgi:regulatory protein|nr:RecX family transcriptional regulator [Cytophagaceae bacterium]